MLYDVCTSAALRREEFALQGRMTARSCMRSCSPASDMSEETDSTADTSNVAETDSAADLSSVVEIDILETDSTTDALNVVERDVPVHDDAVASLSKALLASAVEQQRAIDCIVEQLQTMCATKQGSLLAQSALALATSSQLEALAASLDCFLIDACKSRHGHHVVQKFVSAAGGGEQTQCIVEALRGRAVALARDRFGCRIVQHLIEVCPAEQVSALIDEMMIDAARLCRHPFANYVMQSVIKAGTPDRRAQMDDIIFANALDFSRHRCAKHVFQLAVLYAEPFNRSRLMRASNRPADVFTIST